MAGLGYHQMRKKSTVKGFLSMIDGFVRIAAITPDLRVADCAGNAAETVRAAQRAALKAYKQAHHDDAACCEKGNEAE